MVVETTQAAAQSTGALGALGVDVKLFIAQLVNFGVVFFVMWQWVYRPLLKVMDERTRKIEQGLKDADAAGTARASAEAEREHAIMQARGEAKRIMEEAARNAEAEGAAIVAKAKAEVERVVTQGKERLMNEQAASIAAIRAEAASIVTLAAEKVLGAKLDGAADKKLVAEALKDVA